MKDDLNIYFIVKIIKNIYIGRIYLILICGLQCQHVAMQSLYYILKGIRKTYSMYCGYKLIVLWIIL